MDTCSLEELQKVLGSFDENLNIITHELALSARVEGLQIVLEGEEENVRLGADVLESLLDILRAEERIDKSRIVYCIELAREGRAKDIGSIMSVSYTI